METDNKYLEFEIDIIRELENQISELKKLGGAKGIGYLIDINLLQQKLSEELKRIYSNLNGWQTVQVARHCDRPILTDYLKRMVRGFRELYGDRRFGDDKAIITGLGSIGPNNNVMIVGHNKGRGINEKAACRFGCPNPEGYRKALLKMKLAEKFGIPVVALIDTPGAYPGIDAEERGQAQAIATNLMEMSRLKVPIVCVVIGEGGSGGALGIGVGDKLAMLEFSYYSVISPEGCAAILWRDGSKANIAAEALKLTAKDLLRLGLVDEVIQEPLGGAHRNPRDAILSVKKYIIESLRDLKRLKTKDLLKKRYQKLRLIGSSYVK